MLDPASEPLRIYGCGISPQVLEPVVQAQRWPVRRVARVQEADAVLSLRQALGREPQVRRQAQQLGLPILVIKADSPSQVQRALERLLRHQRSAQAAPLEASDPSLVDDSFSALEECRLAVEQVVLPQGRPVELLPRSERVRALQAELVGRYRLRSAVFGQGGQQRLRVFPP